MTERMCPCGCGESIDHLAPQARFLSDAHRKRYERYGYHPPEPKVCWCGESFLTTHRIKKFCSKKCQKRAFEAQTRGTCQDCGATLGAGSGFPGRHVTRCRDCYALVQRTVVDERAQQIEAWWAEGLMLKEIAPRLGWTVVHLSVEMDSLRAKGYDLPYRYRGEKNGTKFPALRKAA